jgi:hypothetical protein
LISLWVIAYSNAGQYDELSKNKTRKAHCEPSKDGSFMWQNEPGKTGSFCLKK